METYILLTSDTDYCFGMWEKNILLAKTTAAQNEVTLSYHKVRGLCFLTVISVGIVVAVVGLTDLYGVI